MKLITPMLLLTVLWCGCATVEPIPPTSGGRLHVEIAGADEVIIRAMRYRSPRKAPRVLRREKDEEEILRLYNSLDFVPQQKDWAACECGGYPQLEWYADGEQLLTASVQHCEAIRSAVFERGDRRLTDESRDLLRAWLTKHGVSEGRLR
jgi:hypothetical protein